MASSFVTDFLQTSLGRLHPTRLLWKKIAISEKWGQGLEAENIAFQAIPSPGIGFSESRFIGKEQVMSNRVLSRAGARELTYEEVQHVVGAEGTGCRGTSLHPKGPIVDILCEPNFP